MSCKPGEHDWKEIKRLFFPKGYSKCIKCGLMRHDEDGHKFRTAKEAYAAAKKVKK